MAALTMINMHTRLPVLSFSLTPLELDDSAVILGPGRIDSYMKRGGVMNYLGGPACLVNCSCDECENVNFVLGRAYCMKATNDITTSQELHLCYGSRSRVDFVCLCGKKVWPRSRLSELLQHNTNILQLYSTRSNSDSDSD